ncbi:MAG: P-loop NTPase fold protein [Nitrosomonadales bacterium]
MKSPTGHHRLCPTEITTLIQSSILGFVFSEIYYLTKAIASVLKAYITTFSLQGFALCICAIAIIILLFYAYFRNIVSDIKRLGRGGSINLFAMTVLAVLGFYISAIVGGVGTSKYQEYVGKVEVHQLMFFTAIPIVIALLFIFKVKMRRDRNESSTSFFINDQDIKKKDEDLLGQSEMAARFAEKVLNGGSSDSLIFGIDAPWGIGKSSFVNICCEYWDDKSSMSPIVHRFEPLRYTDGADIVGKFISELIATIEDQAFVPSIRSLFSKYLRLVKGKSELSFLGIKLDLESGDGSVDDILRNLEVQLSALNRKIIIVVDDLDRLSWTEVKNILFAIKRSFMLPNVTYILCYDTENLASMENTYDDAEKVKEFLKNSLTSK